MSKIYFTHFSEEDLEHETLKKKVSIHFEKEIFVYKTPVTNNKSNNEIIPIQEYQLKNIK